MQGYFTICKIVKLYVLNFCDPNILIFITEICVKKIKELSEHGMIWTDDDGFLLKPSGTYVSHVLCNFEYGFD